MTKKKCSLRQTPTILWAATQSQTPPPILHSILNSTFLPVILKAEHGRGGNKYWLTFSLISINTSHGTVYMQLYIQYVSYCT